tara:strand:- start:190 stop:393 length:204 start_codon:yes stop_codon:yes gene_type:complete
MSAIAGNGLRKSFKTSVSNKTYIYFQFLKTFQLVALIRIFSCSFLPSNANKTALRFSVLLAYLTISQ